MPAKFQAAFTREFLDASGQLAYGDIGLALLDESPLITYRFLETYATVVTPEQIHNVDGLFIHDPYVTQHTLSKGAGRLTVISRFGAGYDRVDVNACTEADVAVINAPDAMRFPTASAALMYILVLAKRLWQLDRLVREGHWDLREELQGIEPRDKTLGIVGFGNVGQELARMVMPLDMHVLAHDPYIDPAVAKPLEVTLVSLEKLLKEADFVSLHCTLTEQTRGLIGARELELMKPTAYLINMARGPVVDHSALVQALTERRIAGAGLDVFYQEPLPPGDPLTRLDNVVLSPHWVAGTTDAFYYIGTSSMEQMLMAARGQPPQHIVNREVLDRSGFQAKLARFRQQGHHI